MNQLNFERASGPGSSRSVRISGASLDYAIELLTFAATDYSAADLKPSAKQFELLVDLVRHGLVAGELVRNASGTVTGLLAGEITQEGVKFLAKLKARKEEDNYQGVFLASCFVGLWLFCSLA